jgi:pantoate--beta-alanine ligase
MPSKAEPMALRTIRTIPELRAEVFAWQKAGLSVGMVPTMGALHAGHMALVDEARRQNARVVVTLFVNPTQFAPMEDLAAYPRDEETDSRKLEAAGVDLLFAPPTEEMYPTGFETTIIVGGPSAGLETDFRPHFFPGVATVVAKLLLAGLPDRAYFGEKDFQQLLVVKKLVRDLNIPTEIVGCPTVREADGLALSSRNAYLNAEERARAPTLHATLEQIAARLRSGEPAGAALDGGRRALAESEFAVDYLDARSAETLAPIIDWKREPVRLLVAAKLGKTRLIDNIAV